MSLFNYTHDTNFVLEIQDAGLTEQLTMGVLSCNLPSMRIPVTDIPTGPKGLGRSQVPGSTFEHDPCMVRIVVDENLNSFTEVYQWMLSINNYITHQNTAFYDGCQPVTAILHVLNNEKDKIVLSYAMHGVWPGDVSEIEFKYDDQGNPVMSMMVMLHFRYFELFKDGVIIKPRISVPEAQEKLSLLKKAPK
ncbi:tail completion protein [Cronobacter phage vB_Cdu_VP8]|nr:tail completion protein [Cronobacter phage vB_Cdu_VP8]